MRRGGGSGGVGGAGGGGVASVVIDVAEHDDLKQSAPPPPPPLAAAAGRMNLGHGVFAVRGVAVALTIGQVGLLAVGVVAVSTSSSTSTSSVLTCLRSSPLVAAAATVTAVSALRLAWMLGSGCSQAAAAKESLKAADPAVAGSQQEGRAAYRRVRGWVWTGRLVWMLEGTSDIAVTLLLVRTLSSTFSPCGLSTSSHLKSIFLTFTALAWALRVVRAAGGSRVLSWRALLSTLSSSSRPNNSHNNINPVDAWRAHYRWTWDAELRELLFVLGRPRFLLIGIGVWGGGGGDVRDEVHDIAAMLADFMAAQSTEQPVDLLTGVARLHQLGASARSRRLALANMRESTPPTPPRADIREAAALCRFANAAYTGPLTDVGRYPLCFIPAWMHRQQVWAPWRVATRPKLEGDNSWRGHAAAFLTHAGIPGTALLKARVAQPRGEAVYFVCGLPAARAVVVSIRGTGSIEDCLSDALATESPLRADDLAGIHGDDVGDSSKGRGEEYYAHAGVVKLTRELAAQLDGDGINDTGRGYLSQLLGPQGRCEGFRLYLVGHSLGSAVASLLAIRLRQRFPYIKAYGFNPVPVLDAETAAACAPFITSVAYNDDIVSRLSVMSVHKLRAKALAGEAAENIGRRPSGGGSSQGRMLADIASTSTSSTEPSRPLLRGDSAVSTSSVNSTNGVDSVNDRKAVPPSLVSRLARQASSATYLISGVAAYVMGLPVRWHRSWRGGRHNKRRIRGRVRPCALRVTKEPPPSSARRRIADTMPSIPRPLSRKDELSRQQSNNEIQTERLHDAGEASTSSNSGSTSITISAPERPPLYLPGTVWHVRLREDFGGAGDVNDHNNTIIDDDDHVVAVEDPRSALFSDIPISARMFLDHMPWRLERALEGVVADMDEEEDEAGGHVDEVDEENGLRGRDWD